MHSMLRAASFNATYDFVDYLLVILSLFFRQVSRTSSAKHNHQKSMTDSESGLVVLSSIRSIGQCAREIPGRLVKRSPN